MFFFSAIARKTITIFHKILFIHNIGYIILKSGICLSIKLYKDDALNYIKIKDFFIGIPVTIGHSSWDKNSNMAGRG